MLLASGGAQAWAWPEVPLPPESAGEIVSSHMKNNGLDMRVSRFTAPGSVEDLVAFYRKKWGDQHVVNQLDGKTIVGRAEGDHYVTVELDPQGSSTTGTIGIMKMPKEKVEYVMGGGFAKPPDTEVFNDIRYYDTPEESRTLGMRNMQTPYVNYQFYARRLQAQDWSIDEGKPCQPASKACVARFTKHDGKIAITMTRARDFSTEIVANIE